MPTDEELAKEFGYQSSSGVSTPAGIPRITVTPNNHEDLAKEFGYDPAYKEPEKQEQTFWQGLANDPTLLGSGKRLGIGILRGAKDVLDTGAEGLAKGTSYVASKVLPTSLSAPIQQSADELATGDKTARDSFNKEYPSAEGVIPNATDVGRVGGQIAATLPVMPMRAIGAINSAAGALPTMLATGQKVAAPLLNRLGAAVGTGALGGATLGASTSSINDKSLAENVGEGAITGAIGGPLVAGAAQAGKSLAGKVVGKISPTRAALAERAEQLGINLKGSQVSDSPTLKKYDQISGMLPFSGAQGISNTQINQFTRAVSKTFGKDVEEITPQVIKQGIKDIGNGMNTLKQNTTVDAGPQLQQDIINILKTAGTNLQESEVKPIYNNLRQIAQKIDSNTNTLSGDVYHNITKYDGLLSKLQNNSNPNIAKAGNDIRDALEKALERSMTPQQLQEWRGLKLQYKSAKTVEDLVNNDPEGKVNPLKLMRKVSQAPGGKPGSGELGELADIGREFFINPADSGTPLGTYILNNVAPYIHNPVSAAAAAGGALMKGAAFSDLGLGATGLTVNRIAREAVNSKTVRDAIIRAGKGSTYGNTNALSQAVEPYGGILVENRNSKKKQLTLPTALEK